VYLKNLRIGILHLPPKTYPDNWLYDCRSSILKRRLGVKQKEPQYLVVSGIYAPLFGFVIEQIRVRGYVLKIKNSERPWRSFDW